jgi:hypothetical protein
MQVFGGHGYIQEHGMEQIVPDARIFRLYEGTTGLQGLDPLGRKALKRSKGKAVWEFTKPIGKFAIELLKTEPNMRRRALTLLGIVGQWNYLTLRIALLACKDREMVSTASHDFLMYSGYATLA